MNISGKHYRTLWEKKWEETQEFGAFVSLPGSELVLVIEHVGGPEKQEAYFHRMSKVRMN